MADVRVVSSPDNEVACYTPDQKKTFIFIFLKVLHTEWLVSFLFIVSLSKYFCLVGSVKNDLLIVDMDACQKRFFFADATTHTILFQPSHILYFEETSTLLWKPILYRDTMDPPPPFLHPSNNAHCPLYSSFLHILSTLYWY